MELEIGNWKVDLLVDARRWTDGSLIFDLFGGRLRKVAGGFKKKWRENHYLNLNTARIAAAG